jgi:hypothetical protein
MAWTYTSGVLTSTGGTEASPDSLLEGIDIVEAADATKGYRDGFVGWLTDVRVNAGGSFIVIDDDAMIELIDAAYLDPSNGGVIHGNRSKLILSTNVNRIDAASDFQSGSTLICRRERPQDPSPQIVYRTSARNDYPTILGGSSPAKVDIQGLDLYGVTSKSSHKVYFGNAAEASVKDLRHFGSGTLQYYNTTYENLYAESIRFASENSSSDVNFIAPSFYTRSPSPGPMGSVMRKGRFRLVNPTFINDVWNGTIADGTTALESSLSIAYTYQSTFLRGLTPVENMNVRFTRQHVSDVRWNPDDATITRASAANGEISSVELLDAYRAGSEIRNEIDRFSWTMKARKYDLRTAGETVYAGRVFFRQFANLSAGYNEEVQVLPVNNLTLTQSEAAALTGISFAASGATGGTVTITENTTAAELWAAYRNWISLTDNFDSEDTWSLVGSTIDLGGWSIVVDGATFTGNVTTTGAFTSLNSGLVTGFVVDANGVLFAVSGLDPRSLGTTWTLGYITEADYQNRDQNAAPATWTGWTQINGTGNTAQVQLAQDTAYRLFHRAPGYDNTTEATVATGETFSTVMTPIADRDLQGALLWPQTAAHATQAAKFTYNAGDGLVDYDNQTGSTDYIPFLAGYRAFGNIVYSPALTFSLRFLPRVNATKDGFVLDPDATLVLRMSNASDASAILEADLSYTDGRKAYDRFVANTNHLFLLYAQMSEVLSSSSVQQVASAVDQSTVLAKEVTVAARPTLAQMEGSTALTAVADVSGLATSAEIAALNDFDPATDVVARVTLVDTVTTNTDMRGTDGANTVAPDNAGIAAIKAKTDNLPNDPAGVSDLPDVSGLAQEASLNTVNEGVKKASVLVPHFDDLPQ